MLRNRHPPAAFPLACLRKYYYRNPINRNYKNLMFLLLSIPSGKRISKWSFCLLSSQPLYQVGNHTAVTRHTYKHRKTLHQEAFLSL